MKIKGRALGIFGWIREHIGDDAFGALYYAPKAWGWLAHQPKREAEVFVPNNAPACDALFNTGKSYTNTATLCCVFTPDGGLRPVVFRQENGYKSDRCDYQAALTGDFVVTIGVWRDEEDIQVATLAEDGELTPVDQPTYKKVLGWLETLKSVPSQWAHGRAMVHAGRGTGLKLPLPMITPSWEGKNVPSLPPGRWGEGLPYGF